MEISFLVTFTFLFFQRFGLSITTTSSNVTCIESERQSLLVFKQSLTETNNRLSTWRGTNCCEWQGVGCDSRNGHIVKLDFRPPVSFMTTTSADRYWLVGKLSHSLLNLKHLRYLDLSMNAFFGNIPTFLGSFEHLEYLNFTHAGFYGVIPHHLGNLSRLQYLDFKSIDYIDIRYFDRNYAKNTLLPIIDDFGWVSSLSSLRYLDLSGITIGKHIDWFHPVNMLPFLHTLKLSWSNISIPSVNFVNLTSLNSLDLSINFINSTIPLWLSNLTSLKHLDLKYNYFHGRIPDFIGMFSYLASIDLSLNSFETFMPDLICNLSSLVYLDLSVNKFFGHIPSSLGLLSRLEDLHLSRNQLSGPIPISLGQLSKLKSLDLSHNSLVGVLSETHFTKLNNLNYLSLYSNSLAMNLSSRWIAPFQLQTLFASSCNTGPHFPTWLQTQSELQMLDLSNSSIRDAIPKWFENILSKIIFLDLSNNLLSGNFPQTNQTINPILEVVNLSKNRLTGNIPVQLCKVPGIRALDLSHNKFSGRLPGCLGNLLKLDVIDFTNNSITGVVPSSLGSLNILRSLHLHNNKFEGDIPESLQNLTGLVMMDLGNNMFMGKIPLQLCKLNALQYLSLAHNNITGTIPRCFGNLSGMMFSTDEEIYNFQYEENILASMKGRELLYTKTGKFLTSLDLSNNNIDGEIPDVLTNLMGLKNLNMSGNLIKGQIPTTIGGLKQLESLDLSMNKLSGRIPQSLSSLHFLSYLNLSFNYLSGPIPVGNQIQTLDGMSIFEGNSGLYGPPLSRRCNRNDGTFNHDGEYEGQGDSEGLLFYAGLGPGFIVGLVGLLGSLHFITRWRVAYFETFEMVYRWLTLSILLSLARLRREAFE